MSEIEEPGAPLEGASEPPEDTEDEAVDESRPLPPIVKLLILVGGVLVLGAGAYFLTQKVILPQVRGISVVEKMTEVKQRLQKPKKEKEKRKKKRGPVIKHPIIGITANIGGSRGRSFVAMDIIVETTSEDSRDEMVDKEYQIRDALIFYFMGRSLSEIATREFQITARDTVRSIINTIIESEPVDTVFFTTFLIQ